MNDQDLRDCFAMFALNGLLTEANGDYKDQAIAELAYSLADAMLEARAGKGTVGLPPVRARKTKEK
jgi:hypothetical protein